MPTCEISLPRGKPEPEEREEGSEDPDCMLLEVRIASQPAQLKMEVEITVDQFICIVLRYGIPHPLQQRIQSGDVGAKQRSEMSSHPFKRGTNLIDLDDIELCEVDDFGGLARSFGDKSVSLEDVDGFAYGGLSDPILLCPDALDDSLPRGEKSLHDLSSQLVRQTMLQQVFGAGRILGVLGLSAHYRCCK